MDASLVVLASESGSVNKAEAALPSRQWWSGMWVPLPGMTSTHFPAAAAAPVLVGGLMWSSTTCLLNNCVPRMGDPAQHSPEGASDPFEFPPVFHILAPRISLLKEPYAD